MPLPEEVGARVRALACRFPQRFKVRVKVGLRCCRQPPLEAFIGRITLRIMFMLRVGLTAYYRLSKEVNTRARLNVCPKRVEARVEIAARVVAYHCPKRFLSRSRISSKHSCRCVRVCV